MCVCVCVCVWLLVYNTILSPIALESVCLYELVVCGFREVAL